MKAAKLNDSMRTEGSLGVADRGHGKWRHSTPRCATQSIPRVRRRNAFFRWES